MDSVYHPLTEAPPRVAAQAPQGKPVDSEKRAREEGREEGNAMNLDKEGIEASSTFDQFIKAEGRASGEEEGKKKERELLEGEELLEREPPTHLYFFTNPGSGSRKARLITKVDYETIVLKSDKAWVHVVDLTKPGAVKRGYSEIKKFQEEATEQDKDIKFVMCGGDGTFMRCIRDLMIAGVDINYKLQVSVSLTQYCLLPFGTGNDFARSYGWGAEMPRQLLTSMQRLTRAVLKCEEQRVNIWDVTLWLGQNGAVHKVGANGKKEEVANGSLKKMMVNYFSIGVDAQIGMGFDKNRTHNRICNKCVYTCEGIKKCLCHRNRSIATIVDYLAREQTDSLDIIVSSDRNRPAKHYLRGNPIAFICTNIDSYMGGMANPWGKQMKTSGLVEQDGQVIPNDFSGEQRCDDGRLEFSTVYSVVGLVTHQSYRVAQEEGPFVVQFYEEEELVTYMNIDGEFYRVINPKKVEVRLSSAVEGGSLRALKRVNLK